MTKITIILLGESGVGKTTILCRLKTGEFQEDLKATCRVDFEVKKLTLDGEEISLFIWDTAGSERYRSIVRRYYRQAEGVLLVYDVTNPESFYSLSSWLSELRANNKEAEALIAGNKNEDPSKNSVGVSVVKSFAEEENLEYMEMSAKSGKNVEEKRVHILWTIGFGSIVSIHMLIFVVRTFERYYSLQNPELTFEDIPYSKWRLRIASQLQQAFLRLAKKILIAKGILTEEASNSEVTDERNSSAENGISGKILQSDQISSTNIIPKTNVKEDPDVIRLDATPTVEPTEKKGCC